MNQPARLTGIGPDDLRPRLAEGVLAFPATPFGADGALDAKTLEAHVSTLVAAAPVALVPAGGAGELFSLTPAEHATIVRTTVALAGKIPVIAGVGFGAGIAVEMAKAAEHAGAAAILLFPPYLIAGEQAGLRAYAERVCRSVGIGVIVYSRDNGVLAADTVLQLAETCPNLIGLKDGTGDFDALSTLKRDAGNRLAIINGAPTAEMLARQCFAIGIRAYSSAVFSFLPELAMRFYEAVKADDRAASERLVNEFYLPLTRLRGRRRGHAVSLIKAGLRAVGKPAGPVRPPLVDFTTEEQIELEALIARVGGVG